MICKCNPMFSFVVYNDAHFEGYLQVLIYLSNKHDIFINHNTECHVKENVNFNISIEYHITNFQSSLDYNMKIYNLNLLKSILYVHSRLLEHLCHDNKTKVLQINETLEYIYTNNLPNKCFFGLC